MTTRGSTTGPSIDDILADIRRQTSATQSQPDEIFWEGAERADRGVGSATYLPATANGSPSAFDVAAMDYDALDDHLDDMSQTVLASAAHEQHEPHDLPSILKSPRHCAVVRPLREPSGRRLSDALRSASLTGVTVLANGIERSEARLRKHFSTSSMPDDAASTGLVAERSGGEHDNRHATMDAAIPDARAEAHYPMAVSEDYDALSHAAPCNVAVQRPAAAGALCPVGSHALVLDAATLAEALEIDLVRSFRYRHGGLAHIDPSHDGAANLLRPMLRRWIDENMPRLIEVALDRELSRAMPDSGYNRAS